MVLHVYDIGYITTYQSHKDSAIEIEPIPDDSVGKYRAEGVEWAI